MADLNEPEIRYASKGFTDAQAMLVGALNGAIARRRVDCGWYDVDAHEFTGSFALVKDGGLLADLVGDIVQITYHTQSVWVYVVESADIDYPIALARRAFLALGDLANDSLRVNVRVRL